MKLQVLAVASAAFVAMAAAGAALAAEPVVAKLQAPVAAKTRAIAGGAIFMCEADACQAAAPTPRTLTAASCKELAKSVGAVASYGDSRKQLDEEKLGKCNAGAATEVAKR